MTNGLFSYSLGPLDGVNFAANPLYVEVSVGESAPDSLLLPRERLLPSPYAIYAASAAWTADAAKLGGKTYDYFAPPGIISAYGGTSDPDGWLIRDGRAVSRSTYSSLFAAIGAAFGQGDGSTTFNIPDFRGRFLRGRDAGAARDPDRTTRTAMASGGNTGDAVGSVQTDAFKSHEHRYRVVGVTRADSGTYTDSQYTAASGGSFQTNWIENTGGNETRPINAYVNFIIKY